MKIIPQEIENVIDRVDRTRDSTWLPKTNTPIEKYDSILKERFPDYQVRNLTEFDYGRSFRYSVVMSLDPNAAALDRERVFQAVRRIGVIELVDVAISTLIPIVLIKFIRYIDRAGQIVQEWSDTPFTTGQEKTAAAILESLGKLGFRRIDPIVAATIVPDVETDLHEKGEMTVADCLFFG